MTLDQLKLVRDSYMVEATRPDGRKSTRGEYVKLSLDGGIDLVTSKDLVVFDDNNEMAHAVCINEDMRSQAMFPVKIISSEYAMIQQVETIMSQKNFEDFLNEGYISGMISEDKKNAMIKWTRAIKNQAQQPLEAEPYFNTNPQIIPKPNSVIRRDDATVHVSTAEGLTSIFSNPITGMVKIQLTEDVNMESTPIVIDYKDADITLDLNGKTLTSSAATLFKITNGNVTVNNGTINTSAEAFRLDATSGTNPELVLGDDVSVVSETDCCIYIKGTAKVTSAADLTSNGEYCPIQGNGKASSAGTEINIIGGKITAADVGIYQPQDGILNLANCEITAKTAVYIKAGTLNISNGSYNGIGDAAPYKFNNNGCNATGDAIVADFCVYPGGVPVININGGTFNSANGKALGVYDKNGNENPEVANDKINISGGQFSTILDADYIDRDYTIYQYPDATEDGYYVIEKDSI